MSFVLTSYAAALLGSTLVSSITAAVAWQRRTRTPGGMYFALMMIGVVIWNALSGLESGTAETAARIVLSKLGYIGIVSVAPLFLHFSLAYGRKERRLGGIGNALLWLMPAVTLLLVFTNERHHLLWTNLTPLATPGGPTLLYGHGPWYWIWVVYNGVVSLSALIILLQAAFQYRAIYVWQSAIFAVGAALPWIGEVLYLARITPFPGLDLPTIGFAGMGAAVLLGMSRFALFNLVPFARTTLVERMSEGVFVLDSRDRVIDINPAATALLRVDGDAVGRLGRDILPALRGLTASGHEGERERRTTVRLDGTPPLILDLAVAALRDGRRTLTGRLVIIRDATVREKLVTELQTALADVRTLRGLLPICSSCKKIRDAHGRWQRVEDYVESHSEAQFTHGLCDDCVTKLYPNLLEPDEP
jgi:PAS domain-containing protein